MARKWSADSEFYAKLQSLEKNIGIGQIKNWNLSKKKYPEQTWASDYKRFYCVDKLAVEAFYIIHDKDTASGTKTRAITLNITETRTRYRAVQKRESNASKWHAAHRK